MKLLRCVVAAGLALGAVSLAGCAGNPDLAPLESRLAALGSKAGPGAVPKGPLPASAKMRGVQRTARRR